MNHEPLRAVILAAAECFVRYPDLLRIELHENTKNITAVINSHKEDVPKLMGAGCRNVKKIRDLGNILTEREYKWFKVSIGEGWTDRHNAPFQSASIGEFDELSVNRMGRILKEMLPNWKIERNSGAEHTVLNITAEELPDGLEATLQSIFRAYGGMHDRFLGVKFLKPHASSKA